MLTPKKSHLERSENKFKKIDSAQCICCKNGPEESLYHILLFCEAYTDIRIPYFSKLNEINPRINTYLNQPKLLTIAILDPESNFLPAAIKDNWLDLNESDRLARHFCYNIHKKLLLRLFPFVLLFGIFAK